MRELIGVIKSLLEGLNLRARWVAVSGLVILILLVFYGLELFTGWNYYRSMNAKVTLLERLNTLSSNHISENSDLYPIYSQLVRDLAARDTAPVAALTFSVAFWKAMTGAFLWVFLAILGLLGTFGKDTNTRAVAVLVLSMLAVVFGYIGSALPTVVNPWVNYVGVPTAQIATLLIWSSAIQKRKIESQAM